MNLAIANRAVGYPYIKFDKLKAAGYGRFSCLTYQFRSPSAPSRLTSPTRTGDDGATVLGTGERRKKCDLQIVTYGTLRCCDHNRTVGGNR